MDMTFRAPPSCRALRCPFLPPDKIEVVVAEVVIAKVVFSYLFENA